MHYFLLAGEASGDIHAAALVRAIRERDPEAHFAGLGGDAMREEGVTLYQDYRKMAYMAIVAVLTHLGDIRRNFRIAKEALIKEQPDALILIDYPSFNLKMADFCRKHLPATKIYYYIPPKVWAWKSWRVHKIARLCDEVLGIFPFEPAFYAKYDYRCTYVGNPTAAALMPLTEGEQPRRKPYIALLPGSRKSEISKCLPTMIAAAEKALANPKPGTQNLEPRTWNPEPGTQNPELAHPLPLLICGAPGIDEDFYAPYARNYKVVFGQTHDLLRTARAAIVNSGTATLEAALLRCPQVPVYHLTCGWIAHLRPLLFPSPFFTLPNIILQREVVREKIAYRFTAEEVGCELMRLLSDEAYRNAQLRDYEDIRAKLGNNDAPAIASSIITKPLK